MISKIDPVLEEYKCGLDLDASLPITYINMHIVAKSYEYNWEYNLFTILITEFTERKRLTSSKTCASLEEIAAQSEEEN